MTFPELVFAALAVDPTPSPSDPGTPKNLNDNGTGGVIWVLIFLLVFAVVAVLIAKWYQMVARRDNPTVRRSIDGGIVRAAMALISISALVILTVLSLYTGAVGDNELKTALITITAAITAFYFSSKSSDSARQDIIQAIKDYPSAPDVTGITIAQARKVLDGMNLRLDFPKEAADTAEIESQEPKPGNPVREGNIRVQIKA
ncbi:hypothetical protein GCM10009837_67190 [Streptomyces durmitorensis]|uniref:PASTA domain-containing protein n=1 Tax=Streptomyces durmitorensis TaxID=319947 RepID=A0ABY4Q7U8_9ACTN|nr:PASTA domain-containing protein [Streptomyces durmitorensis]UQT61206.1 hypothetical protein M4V62_42450 [Streptomyces durmitorensis]